MPEIRRGSPPYRQIADHFQRLIASGHYQPGDKLPTVRQIGRDWGVAINTARRAMNALAAEQLVNATYEGTFVRTERLTLGPQQRLTSLVMPVGERTEVLAAGIVRAPAYIVPILNLPGRSQVIRREQVSYERSGKPYMLAVAWFRPELAQDVPELLELEPVPTAGGAIKLIEQRTGRRIIRGRQAREARLIKDDGREGPLLQLELGTACLAEVYTWFDVDEIVEYGEYVLIMNRVAENEFDVAESDRGSLRAIPLLPASLRTLEASGPEQA
jgi:DNA-binding GntR family transcriptional regulator